MCSEIGRGKTRAPWRFVIGGAALAIILAGCNNGPSAGPAPVVMKGPGDAGWQGPPPGSYAPPPMASISPRPLPPPTPMHAVPVPPMEPLAGPAGANQRVIVVERGQSLGRIAEHYRVPKHEIIDANHLKPPYKVEIGQRLVLPGGGDATSPQTAQADTIPLGGPPPQPAAGAPAVVPLDGPAPQASSTLRPPPGAIAPPGERSVAEEAREDSVPSSAAAAPPPAAAPAPPAATHGGRFPWPVRGNVISNYDGGKNDGINIAAPLGAPVRAIEGGEVAYAGNELKGYGNLLLIKHADGLISAYAHCQELLVKKGDRVAPGEVIARVGTTGGVKEPQLHFELREGQRPVDPKQFLAPAPSAANPAWSG